jgi:hypothetical protein
VKTKVDPRKEGPRAYQRGEQADTKGKGRGLYKERRAERPRWRRMPRVWVEGKEEGSKVGLGKEEGRA